MAAWEELRNELGVALNEADLLGFEVDPARRIATATFRVLTLPAEGPPPADRRVQMLFRPVGRVPAERVLERRGGGGRPVLPRRVARRG